MESYSKFNATPCSIAVSCVAVLQGVCSLFTELHLQCVGMCCNVSALQIDARLHVLVQWTVCSRLQKRVCTKFAVCAVCCCVSAIITDAAVCASVVGSEC